MELTAIHEDSALSREGTYCYAFLTKNLLKVSVEGEDVSHNFRGLAAEFCFTFYVYSVCIHPAPLALSCGWDGSPKITARHVISKSNEQISAMCILNSSPLDQHIVISCPQEMKGLQFPGRLQKPARRNYVTALHKNLEYDWGSQASVNISGVPS